MEPTLLIVEDEPGLREVLSRSLRAEGFEVEAVGTGHALIARALQRSPDVLVIDIGLPDADGRDVCQALRTQGIDAPVLFLTARDALPDRISGFTSGGDDYVTKPFDLAEVAVRLRSLIRRAGAPATPTLDGLNFDPGELTVSAGGVQQTLTQTEFRLLAALAGRGGSTVTRRELIAAAWPHGAIVHDNTLDVYIARLRRKLRAIPGAPPITTVHGTGYRLK
jgi:two-component system OmpR family response regulator